MKINPINNVQIHAKKTLNVKKNIFSNNVDNKIKNILLPTTFALAMLVPSKISAQNVLPKDTTTEVLDTANSKLPYYIQDESIQYSKEFEMDEKKYTMYYTIYCVI